VEFDEFYRKSYRRIVGQLYTVIGVLTDAEDIAQESFLAASRAWETVGEYENPEAWVRRVALNHASNLRRRAARKSRALIRLAGGQRHADAADTGSPELIAISSGIGSALPPGPSSIRNSRRVRSIRIHSKDPANSWSSPVTEPFPATGGVGS
jgi:Sigma-70 region 2